MAFASCMSFGGDSHPLTVGYASSGMTAPTQEVASKKGREDKQTCLPVTIRIIEQAVQQQVEIGSDVLHFHGAEANMLILIANVESIVQQAASIECVLNDGTGRINARYFLTGRCPKELEALAPGSYISVFGTVR